ncbi:MAG: ribosomal protein S18-alanine N-acetyltransferase [Syntrophobacterales bacterium]
MAKSAEDIHAAIPGLDFRHESKIGEGFRVEPMRPADLAQVLAIERESFKSPWSKASFEAELGKPYGGLKVIRLKGGDHVDPVLGYICFWLVADELQITNLAVHPEYRRRSIGWQLLLHAFQLGHAAGARFALLEVGRSNRAARALYEKLGFMVVHKRPCYYPESREDGLVMELNLEPYRCPPKPVKIAALA